MGLQPSRRAAILPRFRDSARRCDVSPLPSTTVLSAPASKRAKHTWTPTVFGKGQLSWDQATVSVNFRRFCGVVRSGVGRSEIMLTGLLLVAVFVLQQAAILTSAAKRYNHLLDAPILSTALCCGGTFLSQPPSVGAHRRERAYGLHSIHPTGPNEK